MMITTGMSDEASALAEQYLAAVRAAAHRVPGDERVELLTDLREHLREAYDQEAEARRGTDWQSGGRDVPVVRQILDDLGSPGSIVTGIGQEPPELSASYAAAEQSSSSERDRWSLWPPERVYDVATLITLMLGGYVLAVVGWVIGVVLLWRGPRWSTGEKVLGTAAWPAAVAVPIAVAVYVPGRVGDVLGVVAVLATVAIWLPFVFVKLARSAAVRRGSDG